MIRLRDLIPESAVGFDSPGSQRCYGRLRIAAVVGALILLLFLHAGPGTAVESDNPANPPVITAEEFRQRLTGPILTFPTPFTADDKVDLAGVRRMIAQALDYDEVQAVTLTAGNNQYTELSYDGVKELTRVVVDAAGDRAMSIASTGFWEKDRVLEYAQFAEGIGASAVQVLKPADASDAEVVAFFQELASATHLPIVLHGTFSPELLRELVKIESIAGMKEDTGLDYLIARQIEFGDRLAIFPGGFDSRVLVGYPYGVRAYYTVFYQFAPELGRKFWQHLERGDLRAAGDFVKQYDYPFAQTWTYPFWVATCAHFGVCEPYVRPREQSLDEAQMVRMGEFWSALSLTPGGPVPFKVLAWNVEVGKSATAEEIGEALKPFDFDVVSFSEAPGGTWTRDVARVLGMEHVVSGEYTTAGHTDKYKTIASRTPLYDVEEILMTDTLHTVTKASTRIDGREIVLYAVHFPFGWRDQAHIDETTAKITSFVDYLRPRQDDEISVVMGDFNFIPSNDTYRSPYHELFVEIGLDVSWKDLGIDVTRRNTHNAFKAEDTGTGKVIDHIMYDPGRVTGIEGGIIEMEKPLADHKPVWAVLQLK